MRNLLRSVVLLLACTAVAVAQTPPGEKAIAPEIQDLGNQRYRIGDIEIDKANSVFTVAGTVLRDAPPLEFLVVTKGGYKAYEALLEVNADAFAFNLACILIGLDASDYPPIRDGAIDKRIEGDPVEILVSWVEDGNKVIVNSARLLVTGEPPQPVASDDWLYTGSVMLEDGRYLAALSGTLIGFVHRSESIIEHKQGIGLLDYGSVAVNSAIIPPVGAGIELIVRRRDKGR